ncbi:MAG: hypothetical protein ACK5M3_19115 [Dysgonomonas sp.]
MSRRYKFDYVDIQFNNPDGLYFISFAVKDWVDVFITTHGLKIRANRWIINPEIELSNQE